MTLTFTISTEKRGPASARVFARRVPLGQVCERVRQYLDTLASEEQATARVTLAVDGATDQDPTRCKHVHANPTGINRAFCTDCQSTIRLCKVCQRPMLMRYPGGDPENGPARMSCVVEDHNDHEL